MPVPEKPLFGEAALTRLVGSAARETCEVEAAGAEAAIKRAIREHDIEPERPKRLAAYRVV